MHQISLHPALLLIGVPLATVGLLALPGQLPRAYHALGLGRLRTRLGADDLPPLLFTLAVALWAALFLVLFFGLLHLIWSVLSFAVIEVQNATTNSGTTPSNTTEFRVLLAKTAALTAVFGAVVALPFTVVRLKLSLDQNRHAENILFNDKLNAAITDLHAQRQVTEWRRKEGRMNVWQDDIIRRNGAIDRLEGLANERPDMAQRIGDMLSVYIKELSREYPPQQPPEGASPDALRDWARGLTPARSDMEKAAQVMGRLGKIPQLPADSLTCDLRGANLQGCDLTDTAFSGADFSQAALQGAYLWGAQLQGAYLWKAQLQGADLEGAALQEATLGGAALQGASLWEAQLQGADLGGAALQGAYLWKAQLQGADLREAALQGADLGWAQVQRADLREAALQGADLRRAALQGADLGGAALQGANLRRAALQGADLWRATFDEDTDLTAATFQGAAVRSVNFTDIPQIAAHLEGMFGDASVTLPKGTPAPAHWPRFELAFDDFDPEWKKWQANPDTYTPPDPPQDE